RSDVFGARWIHKLMQRWDGNGYQSARIDLFDRESMKETNRTGEGQLEGFHQTADTTTVGGVNPIRDISAGAGARLIATQFLAQIRPNVICKRISQLGQWPGGCREPRALSRG